MFDFIKLAGEKIKSSLEETIDKIGDKKNDIIDTISTTGEKVATSLSTTGEKVVTTIKNGKELVLTAVSNIVNKVKEKIDENNENLEKNDYDDDEKNNEKKEIEKIIELNRKEDEYEKQKYEAIGNNSIYTSDENWGICPITQCYMENPVITPSGVYYDKKAILDWISKSPYDPFTREFLTSDMLMEDNEYRNAIKEYRKNHNV
jgi:hypothetical protein